METQRALATRAVHTPRGRGYRMSLSRYQSHTPTARTHTPTRHSTAHARSPADMPEKKSEKNPFMKCMRAHRWPGFMERALPRPPRAHPPRARVPCAPGPRASATTRPCSSRGRPMSSCSSRMKDAGADGGAGCTSAANRKGQKAATRGSLSAESCSFASSNEKAAAWRHAWRLPRAARQKL